MKPTYSASPAGSGQPKRWPGPVMNLTLATVLASMKFIATFCAKGKRGNAASERPMHRTRIRFVLVHNRHHLLPPTPSAHPCLPPPAPRMCNAACKLCHAHTSHTSHPTTQPPTGPQRHGKPRHGVDDDHGDALGKERSDGRGQAPNEWQHQIRGTVDQPLACAWTMDIEITVQNSTLAAAPSPTKRSTKDNSPTNVVAQTNNRCKTQCTHCTQ